MTTLNLNLDIPTATYKSAQAISKLCGYTFEQYLVELVRKDIQQA